ncbi:MAG: hypothetical protein ABI707_00170 [Ferruginibacter sp.]
MKKFIISIITIVLTASIIFSCRKSDNPKLPALTRVPIPLITPDPTANTVIKATDVSGFNGKFSVDLYFKNDIIPKQLDIVVAKNHNYTDGAVKPFKAAIASFPTDVTVTGTQIAMLFPGPIVVGDVFEFGANIILQDGTMFPAFDSVGAAYGQTGGNVDGYPNASLVAAYAVVCPFDRSIFSGGYKIIIDSWQDFDPGDAVTVTPGPGPSQVSLTVYPSPAFGINRKPFIIDIDPATGKVSIASQIIGDYPPSDNNVKISATPGVNSFVDFCSGKIHLGFDLTDAHSGILVTGILEIGK